MPFGELKNLNLNKLLPMFPDRIVTHVPGLDRYRAVTVGSGAFSSRQRERHIRSAGRLTRFPAASRHNHIFAAVCFVHRGSGIPTGR